MAIDFLLKTPTSLHFSPRDFREVRAGPPLGFELPPFYGQPNVLREEADKIADDLGRLMRKYEGLVAARTQLKLLPVHAFNRRSRTYNKSTAIGRMDFLNQEIQAYRRCITLATRDLHAVERDVEYYMNKYRLSVDLYHAVKKHIYCLK